MNDDDVQMAALSKIGWPNKEGPPLNKVRLKRRKNERNSLDTDKCKIYDAEEHHKKCPNT